MSIFRRKKATVTDVKESEIQAVRKDTFEKIDKSTQSSQKLINLIDRGITENIFDATGGNRRRKK